MTFEILHHLVIFISAFANIIMIYLCAWIFLCNIFWLLKNLPCSYCFIRSDLRTLTWSYILCKKKFHNGGSRPALSSLKKEFWDDHLHSHPKCPSRVNSSFAVEPDSLLLPLLYNPQPSPKPQIVSPPIEASPVGSNSHDSNFERYEQDCSLLGFQFITLF